jgi:MFS family permease
MARIQIAGPADDEKGGVAALLPIMAAVFIAYLVIGLAMPVLPVHVHQGLGLGTFVVGLVAGSQFAASLISRFWAGHRADTLGAMRTVAAGLLVAAAEPRLRIVSHTISRQTATNRRPK